MKERAGREAGPARSDPSRFESATLDGASAFFATDRPWPEGASMRTVKQVHGDGIVVVADAGDIGIREADGLVTALRGVTLAIKTADCVAVLLSDPRSGTVAAVHAGWRGVAAGIVPRVIDAMARHGASGASIEVALGPAAGPCCYEVGDEVVAAIGAVTPGARSWLERAGGAKPHVDLREAIRRQLAARGVARVAAHPDCTICSPRGWPSYRREGRGAGRIWATIARAV
ncbi:MAG: peptidoglycan editing factor PgeF [Acidobacteriota bacterium]